MEYWAKASHVLDRLTYNILQNDDSTGKLLERAAANGACC